MFLNPFKLRALGKTKIIGFLSAKKCQHIFTIKQKDIKNHKLLNTEVSFLQKLVLNSYLTKTGVTAVLTGRDHFKKKIK